MIWDEHTYLMADPNLVIEEENTSMVREEAFKHRANPIMRLTDRPLTLGGRATSLGFIELIVKQAGTYRMWYQIRGVRQKEEKPPRVAKGRHHDTASARACKEAYIGYAESRDGVHWKPVSLGQESVRGSKRNNVVHFPAGKQPRIRVCGFLHDPLDREYPFKCVYYRPAKGTQAEIGQLARHPWMAKKDWWFIWGLGRSQDGIHWEPPQHKHNLVNANPEHARLHRALDGGLILSDQGWASSGPLMDIGWQMTFSARDVKAWVTYDGETAHRIPGHIFSLPEHMTYMNRLHGWGEMDMAPWVQPHVGLQCARKGPTVVALNGYLYCCPAVETYAQVADIGLCVSDTGVIFREVWPFRPFIPRGERGAWDFGMAAQCAILDDQDETRFYYIGGDVGNFASTYLPGLAYVPRDRYGYRLIRGGRNTEKKLSRASFGLRPCTLPAKPKIRVNVSQVTAKRVVRVELADSKGKALPGYAFKSCVPVRKEGLRQPIRWQSGRSGQELGGREVRIRVQLESPDCGIVCHDSPRVYAVYAQ